MLLRSPIAPRGIGYAGILAGAAGLVGPLLGLGHIGGDVSTLSTVGQLFVILWLFALGGRFVAHSKGPAPEPLIQEHLVT